MNPIDRVLSILAPHSCVGCGREGAPLCPECADTIESLPSICYACGKATRSGMPCTACIHTKHPSHVWICSAYDGLVKEMVHAYKFEQQRAMAPVMAGMLDDALPYFAEQPLVTFVPTSSSHYRERGFDHAELLTRELCKRRRWHYMRLLHRTTQVRQLGATRAARKQQLNDAFALATPGLIKNQHILLIDDVITTGATIEACSRVLRAAGARQVDVVAFARTP